MNNWNQLKPESKVWIYGSSKVLNEQQTFDIQQRLEQFCETWAAHGAKLNCGFQVLYNRFIIIAVDEESAAASGCSIDKSVEIIKRIDESYGLDLFNRMRSYMMESVPRPVIIPVSVENIKAGVLTGEFDEDTRIVNMQATKLQDLVPNITVPLGETWLRKYLATGSTL